MNLRVNGVHVPSDGLVTCTGCFPLLALLGLIDTSRPQQHNSKKDNEWTDNVVICITSAVVKHR